MGFRARGRIGNVLFTDMDETTLITIFNRSSIFLILISFLWVCPTYLALANTSDPPDAYQSGLDAENSQDYVLAMKWYQKVAEQGNHDAANRIGLFYCFGQGVKQDYQKAIEWFKKGNGGFYIAHLYEAGQGVKKDHQEALKWYRLAAEQGDPNAQRYLDNLETETARLNVNGSPITIQGDLMVRFGSVSGGATAWVIVLDQPITFGNEKFVNAMEVDMKGWGPGFYKKEVQMTGIVNWSRDIDRQDHIVLEPHQMLEAQMPNTNRACAVLHTW